MLSTQGQQFLELMKNHGHEIEIDTSEMELPTYYDESKVKSAQKMFQKNQFSMMFAMYLGSVTILTVPTVLNVLIYTKKSSSLVTAYRRYMMTIFHTYTWFRNDLKEGTKAWTSIKTVRNMHSNVNRSAQSAKVGSITQKDLSLTQFSYFGLIVLFKKELGIQCNDEEMENFCHLWRVLGHLHGIRDEFNLACDTMEATIERLKIVKDELLMSHVTNTSEHFEEMTKYLVSGLQCFDFIDFYEPIVFMLRRLFKVPGYYYLQSEIPENFDRSKLKYLNLSYSDRVNLFASVIIRQYLLNYFIIRWFFNIITYINEFFVRYIPIIAIIRFGPRKAFVEI